MQSESIRTPPSPKKIRRICLLTGTVVFLFCTFLYLLDPQLLRDIEGRMLDARFQLRGEKPVTDMVAIAAIDDASLESIGRWPWSRATIARLIEDINKAGAGVVALDIVFAEPQDPQLLTTLENTPQLTPGLVEEVRQILQHSSPDTQLTKTFSQAGNIIAGYYFYTDEKNTVNATVTDSTSVSHRIPAKAAVTAVKSKIEAFEVSEALSVVSNLPQLSEAAFSAGYFNIDPGEDGIVRKEPLVIRYNDTLYPSLAIKTMAAALGGAPVIVHVEDYGISHITVGDERINTDEFGRLVLNYRGPPKTIPTWSAVDILNGNLPDTALRDKIVILGVPAIGVEDMRSTSFGPSFPGVEIQATVLENLIAHDALNINNLVNLVDLGTMLAIALLLSLAFPRLKGMFMRSVFATGILAVYLIVNYQFFVQQELWITLVYPLLAWLLVFTSLSVYMGVAVERTVSSVRSAFKSYLHPGLVDRLAQDPKLLQFGGEQKNLTILFSDIRNFTNLSETLSPHELSRFLRCYMDPMTEEVFKSRGTLDKYIGDAVMAIFGAPYPSDNHPENACRCALNMIERLNSIKDCCPDLERLFPINIGVGIHTGEVVVGNLGSSHRFTYTVLGDNVNLASRLEGMSKVYGVNIVISESTYQEVKDKFICRELDRVRVKGKKVPIRLFELMGVSVTDQARAYVEDWHTALETYKQQQWRESLERFTALQEKYGVDKASGLYIERINNYIAEPPIGDWDGVYTHTTK